MADPVITTTWPAIASVFGVMTFLIGAATAYLRLFVKGAIGDLERVLQKQFDGRFVQKELLELKVGDLTRRVDRLERNEGSE